MGVHPPEPLSSTVRAGTRLNPRGSCRVKGVFYGPIRTIRVPTGHEDWRQAGKEGNDLYVCITSK